MRHILSTILLAAGMSASAQSVHFNFQEGHDSRYFNDVSTKEIKAIHHDLDADGNGIISIDMLCGPTYVYDTDSINETTFKPADNLKGYKNGDLVSITYQRRYTSDVEFANDVFPADGSLAYGNKVLQGQLLALAYLPGYDNPYTLNYQVYNIEYVSTDFDGKKIKMSGRVVFPFNVKDERTLKLSRIFLEHHFTTFQNSQAPTQSFTNQPFTSMVARGYLVVQPDLMGFGKTANRSQLFVDQDLQPRHIVDCLTATMHLVDVLKTDSRAQKIYLADDVKIINEGASQGAATAIATQRFLENNLTDEEKAILPPLEETRACAGPYSPMLTFEEYCKWDKLYYSSTMPMIVQGAIVNHADKMIDRNGNRLYIEDYLSDKLKTARFPQYENLNVWEMITSKNYNSTPITAAIWSLFGSVEEKYASVREMLNDGICDKATGKLNYSDPRVKAISDVLKRSDNTHPLAWKPKAKITLWHGPNDNIVPYSNTTKFYNEMTGVYPDADITFNQINDEGLGNHVNVCTIWVFSEILGISFEDTVTLLKYAGVIE